MAQRSGAAAVLCVICIFIANICPAQESAENGSEKTYEWPMVAGDAAWTGYSADPRVKPPFRLKWVHQTEGTIGTTPIVAGGRVIASPQQGALICLDAENGRVLWERQMASSTAKASSDGRRVFVAQGGITVLDAATGKKLWKAGSPIVAGWRAAPAFKDGVVYWGLRKGGSTYVAGFKVEDGKKLWEAKVGGAKCYMCAPSVGGGRVLVTTTIGKKPDAALALDEKTGQEKWRVPGLSAKRAISTDGKRAYVADAIPGVTALDLETGDKLWHWGGVKRRNAFYTRELTCRNAPGVAYGRLYVKSYFGFFNVLNPATGKVDWSFDDGAGTGCAMPSAAGGYIYFGTGNYARKTGGGRLVHAIDHRTHKSVWSYRTGGRICSAPAVAYGRLYATGNDGRVYCFEPCPADYQPPVPQPPPAEPAAPPKPMAGKFEGQPGTAGTAPEKPPGGEAWPMYGGCPARCGLELKIEMPIKPAWSFKTGEGVRSSPVISGGTAYVGSDDGKLYALELATGKERWAAEIGLPVRCAPAVAGGLVICGADDGILRAFDAARGGEPKWQFRTGGPVIASPGVIGERVVFASHDHHCYCVRLSDGREFWRFKADHEVHTPPAVARGTVFVGDWMWKLHALDLGTGKPLSGFKVTRVRDLGRPEGIAVYRGVIGITSGEDEGRGWGFALDADTGRSLASTRLGPTFGAPAFGGRFMFLPAVWRSLALIDLQAGKTGSSRLQCREPMIETPLVAGNVMIAATKRGAVRALNITDGKEPAKTLWEWKSPGGGKIATAPAAAGGFIVLGSDDGNIYGFAYSKAGSGNEK